MNHKSRLLCSGLLAMLLAVGCSGQTDSLDVAANASDDGGDTVKPTGSTEKTIAAKDVASKAKTERPSNETSPKPKFDQRPIDEVLEGMAWIPGGTFQMGGVPIPNADPDDVPANTIKPDELPVHEVELDGFYMDKTEVTNAEFLRFVEATGYVTLPERKPEIRSLQPGVAKIEIPEDGKFSMPGSVCLNPKLDASKFDPRRGAYNWWDYLPGANWRHPEGPESSIEDRMDHPVVHVSWLDAKAYCEWAGKELPTEAQWEYAARGGKEQKLYPWGNERNPEGEWRNNIWQGNFPLENTEQDGYRTTAPVGQFPPNGYGLYDTSGNVWEWVADYYRPDYYKFSPRKNPQGPKTSFDPQEPTIVKRVQRGGSFMCSDSYCVAYRNSARMKGEEDTGAFHTGFRCVMTKEAAERRRANK